MSPFDGKRARALRQQANVGIDDLAIAAGISPNTVRAAESSKHQPCPRVAKALAKTLGVPLGELHAPGPGLTLRDHRRRLGLTQAQIAERIGVVRQMVSQVERGLRGVRSPAAWAAAYGLTPAQWTRAHKATRERIRTTVAERIRRRRRPQRGENT